MQEIYLFLQKNIQSNQFFQGAVGAAVIGGLIYQLKSLGLSTWKLLLRTTSVSITVNNEDVEHYARLNSWLVKNKLHKSIRNIEVVTLDHSNRVLMESETKENPVKESVAFITPSDFYYTSYRFLPVKISFSSETSEMNKEVRRNMKIIFYFRTKKFLQGVQADIEKFVFDSKAKERKLQIKQFSALPHFDWHYSYTNLKTLDTVFLPKNGISEIKEDLSRFIDNKNVYHILGKAYKRNYLLVGPPGTGKSSLAKAIASSYKEKINVALTSGTEQEFIRSINSCTMGVTLMEDIDCTKIETDREVAEKEEKISLSSLLNVLDGIQSMEDTITILTTNDMSKLDPAIFRSGRIDRIIYMDYLSDDDLTECITFFNTLLGREFQKSDFSLSKHKYGDSEGYRPSDVSEKVFQLLTT